MEIELGQIVNVLAEAVNQDKSITEEVTVAIGVLKVRGREYQLQATLEPIRSKHVEPLQIVSQGKVVVKDTQTLFPEPEEIIDETEKDLPSSEDDDEDNQLKIVK